MYGMVLATDEISVVVVAKDQVLDEDLMVVMVAITFRVRSRKIT